MRETVLTRPQFLPSGGINFEASDGLSRKTGCFCSATTKASGSRSRSAASPLVPDARRPGLPAECSGVETQVCESELGHAAVHVLLAPA